VTLEHVVDGSARRAIVGDVERNDVDLDAGVGRRLAQAVRFGEVAHRRDDRASGAAERNGRFETDPCRATGDEHDGHGASWIEEQAAAGAIMTAGSAKGNGRPAAPAPPRRRRVPDQSQTAAPIGVTTRIGLARDARRRARSEGDTSCRCS
jgi:hypothetical protein